MSNHAFDCAWLTSYQACTCGHDNMIRDAMATVRANAVDGRYTAAVSLLRDWAKENKEFRGWSKMYDACELAEAIEVVLAKIGKEDKP